MSVRPIGIFDSGYGGLTVFRAIRDALPQYDYLYLGDNARAPYGNRSFQSVYEYTRQSVQWFFDQHCPLVILACNTASAKALRTIQMVDLPLLDESRRVLGVIRPTAEVIGQSTTTGHIGVLGTRGTILSGSYPVEIAKFAPLVSVHGMPCPMWVPIIENGEAQSPGASYFVERYLSELLTKAPQIDTILLACTHYPLLMPAIRAALPASIKVVSQGPIVARSLVDYLSRHPEMETRISAGGQARFVTTDSPEDFDRQATVFFGEPVTAEYLHLP
jgi:glutamate racemase